LSEAWIIDDTGFPRKGRHSVGVARQYCGLLGKQDNCQAVVSLPVSNHHGSLPVAHRLYLPEPWVNDVERRTKAGIPPDTVFKTKPEIALDLIRAAQEPATKEDPRRLSFPLVINPADPPSRPERHPPNSITTLRRRLIVGMVEHLPRCPCCGVGPTTRNQRNL
jgi:hypothetical protein